MLKLPFIETSYVGIHIEGNEFRWVELSKLGNKVKTKSFGSLPVEDFLEKTIEDFKKELSTDSYHIGICVPETLSEIFVEDVSVPDEESEGRLFFDQYEKRVVAEYNEKGLDVTFEIIEVEEEQKRIIGQAIDTDSFKGITKSFEESGLYPVYITNGLFDVGYTQISNPDFIAGTGSVLTKAGGFSYLLVYDGGTISQAYSLGREKDLESELFESDSILKSEELTREMPPDSIPLFYSGESLTVDFQRVAQHSLTAHTPGKKSVPSEYDKALGTAIKMAYPELDSLNLQLDAHTKKGEWNYAKSELIRLSVLLFAPLIFFFLSIYAVEKIIEPGLFEATQVVDKISGNLALVEEEQEKIRVLQQEFLEKRADFEDKVYVTEHFEIIASLIPRELWLTELDISNGGGGVHIMLEGESSNSNSISTFLRRFQDHPSTENVRLVSSETIFEGQNPTNEIAFTISIAF